MYLDPRRVLEVEAEQRILRSLLALEGVVSGLRRVKGRKSWGRLWCEKGVVVVVEDCNLRLWEVGGIAVARLGTVDYYTALAVEVVAADHGENARHRYRRKRCD